MCLNLSLSFAFALAHARAICMRAWCVRACVRVNCSVQATRFLQCPQPNNLEQEGSPQNLVCPKFAPSATDQTFIQTFVVRFADNCHWSHHCFLIFRNQPQFDLHFSRVLHIVTEFDSCPLVWYSLGQTRREGWCL